MKRLSELTGDAFMDALYALAPIMPALETIDYSGLQDSTKTAMERGISFVTSSLSKLLPALTSKENRRCVWEIISILDEVPISEIKEYPAPKLVFKIRKLFAEGELKNFLNYAESSDTTE